jgi:hypothetical protein
MKSSIFWNITQCYPLKVNRRIEGTCHLHLHGRRINQARNQLEAGSKKSFQRTTWHYIPVMRQNIRTPEPYSHPSRIRGEMEFFKITLSGTVFNRLGGSLQKESHVGINPAVLQQSQKIKLFTTPVRTSNPTISRTIISRLAYSLSLKMEATYSSERSADFQRTTRRYIQYIF